MNHKILITDDDASVRHALANVLISEGYEVAVAASGDEAVARLMHDGPFDMLLLDLSMPLLNGWEATKRLKSAAETRDIPVIALTADAMCGDREKAEEAGCDDYDTKPIELPRLLGKIEALLQRGRPS